LIDTEEVVCFAKNLLSEDHLGVTYQDKLASWNQAREIGVCPPFKLLDRDPLADPQDEHANIEEQHYIVVEAGVTL